MKKAWKIYEKKTMKEENSKLQKGIFLISHEKFKVLELSILPSIDEEDRKRSISKKLEERFVEVQELPFLYYEVMGTTFEEERILCCYLKEQWQETEFPAYIECATPSFLFAKSLFEKKEGLLLDYGKKEILLCTYVAGKITSFQRIDYLEQKEIVHNIEKGENILLTGEYHEEDFLYWSGLFSVISLEKVKLSKLKREIDIFQHQRLQKQATSFYQTLFSKGLIFLLIVNVILGFYYQYRIETIKEILGQLEEENKVLEVDSRKLEEKIGQIREEQEQEIIENSVVIKKIVPYLKKIHSLSPPFEIISLEYLEKESFKLQFHSFSTKEYLRFLRRLLLDDFQFVNHDYIERKEEGYLFEIEVIKKEEL